MTNTETATGRFADVRGSLLETGDFVLLKGRWYRLDARKGTDASQWTQVFVATPKVGTSVLKTINFVVEYHVYVEREI